MRGALLVTSALLIVAGGGPDTPAGAQGRKSVRDGVYSEVQAERGRKSFEAHCAACHRPDEFAGEAYMARWVNKSANDFFQLVRRTMPEDNPGGLTRQQYADLLAFFFKTNGLPPGDHQLDATDAALDAVRIEGPFTP